MPPVDDTQFAAQLDQAVELIRAATLLDWELGWDGDGITVTRPAVCVNSGNLVPMTWSDGEAGDRMRTRLRAAELTGEELAAVASRAVVEAAAAHELHELTEWFRLDGTVVWDPHPTGRRFEPAPLVTVQVTADDDPPRPSTAMSPMIEWADPTVDVHQLAGQLCERVSVGDGTFGGRQRFTVHGDHLVHLAQHPDRTTGEVREWSWSREILAELLVPAETLDEVAELTRALLEEMAQTMMDATVHEICEHLQIEGVRVFDPHPMADLLHIQRDLLRPRLEFRHAAAVSTPAVA